MQPRVLCLLEEGFEEIEAITPIDLLRRADIGIITAAVNGSLRVTGRSNITLVADAMLDDALATGAFDMLLIPGGPAVARLRKNPRVTALIQDFHQSGKLIAAICAAPLLLHDAALLEGRRFTAHSSTRPELPGATDDRIVQDGHLITSRGAGTSIDFALTIITQLAGPEKSAAVANAIMA